MLAPPSMDIPVAIPETGQEFVVEASVAQMRPIKQRRNEAIPEDDVIPLASDSF
jgi:hypothetical protein